MNTSSPFSIFIMPHQRQKNLGRLFKDIQSQYANRKSTCRKKQCDALNRKQSRCRNCLGEKSVSKKFCWIHNKHAPQIFFSRSGQVALGFDERLLEDETRWFADDTIISGLKLIAKSSSAELFFFVFSDNVFTQMFKTSNTIADGSVIIFLVGKHFICGLVGSRNELILYDTMVNYTRRNVEFVSNCKRYFGFDNVGFSENIQQQPNTYDCGPYALAIAKDLSIKKSPENVEYLDVRNHVLFSLMTQKFLQCDKI